MKKKLAIGVLAIVLVIAASVGIYAAMNSNTYEPAPVSCCPSVEIINEYAPPHRACG